MPTRAAQRSGRWDLRSSAGQQIAAVVSEEEGEGLIALDEALTRLAGISKEADQLSRAYALHRERCGDEHPEAANSMINLAAILHAQGEYSAADSLFREGLSVKRRLIGGKSEDVTNDMVAIAARS